MSTDFADPNAAPKSKVVSTGSSEIDKKLGGGIPLGSMTLIEGESDSGKSVLSQQMIWGSLYDGFNVVLYTTENTLKSFVRQMSSLSLEISDFLLLGRLKIFTIQASKLKLTPEEVFTLLLNHLKANRETDIVVMDSLTTFITHTSIEDTMSYFENCKELCDEGMSVINIVNSYAFNEAGLARVRSISDAHLTLKTEQMGDMIVKVLEVAKVRGAELSTGNIISFDVEPMLGMKIIPINKVSV
jgi:flagellar protein FlaH